MLNLSNVVDEGLAWLDGTGPNADIVLSSRVRLARNVSGYHFQSNIGPLESQEIMKKVETTLSTRGYLKEGIFIELDRINDIDRKLLLERHLISRDLLGNFQNSGLVITDGGRLSLMVGEEDHLRIQSLMSGFILDECWKKVEHLEKDLGETLDYAYHPRFGFLTACPTNTGTGIRASVLIHLPGLVLTKEIGKVLRGISQIGLTFRGIYGEGSDVMGNYFQISNQTSLGKTEEELIDHLSKITKQVVEYELNAREILIRDARVQIEDKIWRAYGILRFARAITPEEGMNLMSAVRLGVQLNVIKGLNISTLNNILMFSQYGHLEWEANRPLNKAERDERRAAKIRSLLDKEEAL
ncbi:MAG: protein arginine kinase [Candidatus Glassbacteria bacterium]